MSNQEIKEALKELAGAPIGTSRIRRAYKNIEVYAPKWLQEQQMIIDQQADEIEKRKIIHEDYRRTALARIAHQEQEIKRLCQCNLMHVNKIINQNSSLELVVKALGYYADNENYVFVEMLNNKPVIDDNGIMARATLDHIRRVAT